MLDPGDFVKLDFGGKAFTDIAPRRMMASPMKELQKNVRTRISIQCITNRTEESNKSYCFRIEVVSSLYFGNDRTRPTPILTKFEP